MSYKEDILDTLKFFGITIGLFFGIVVGMATVISIIINTKLILDFFGIISIGIVSVVGAITCYFLWRTTKL